jgi:hypothetical protein
MKNLAKIKQWGSLIEDLEYDEKIKNALIFYIKKSYKYKNPIIFNIVHLSALLSIDYDVLLKMINSPKSFYYEFKIPKRSSGFRIIDKPYPSLVAVQKWIHYNILNKKEVHYKAFGFVKKKSIIDNAKLHLDKNALLTVDLKDFFTSIKKKRVISLFQRIGYPDHISYFLASLCCKGDYLPQGASTSPIISNLVSVNLDKRLDLVSKSFGLEYSRYADDIAISGNHISINFLKIVQEIIKNEGFVVNSDKVRLIRGKERKKIITGVSVTTKETKLPKKTKRLWKMEIHFLIKNGLEKQLKFLKKRDPIYIERYIGKLNFWLQVEPQNKFVINSLASLEKMLKTEAE